MQKNRQLFNSIMNNVKKEVIKALNEADLYDSDDLTSYLIEHPNEITFIDACKLLVDAENNYSNFILPYDDDKWLIENNSIEWSTYINDNSDIMINIIVNYDNNYRLIDYSISIDSINNIDLNPNNNKEYNEGLDMINNIIESLLDCAKEYE